MGLIFHMAYLYEGSTSERVRIPSETKTAIKALYSCFNMEKARNTPKVGNGGGGTVI